MTVKSKSSIFVCVILSNNYAETAKTGLEKNPTEGQVETDVVLPLLNLLGCCVSQL